MDRRRFLTGCGVGTILALLASRGFATDPAVAAAVARHAESLKRISSYQLRIESYHSKEEQPGAPLVHDHDLEVWSSGARHRSRTRVFVSLGPDGWIDHGPNGEVWDTSVDDRQARSLSGWDPEHPFALPLDPARNPVEFASVRCSIQPWDPRELPARKVQEASAMHWQLRTGMTLARLAELCELTVESQPDASVTRIKIVSSRSPEMAAREFVRVGTTLDLDHEHGWQIRRIESPYEDATIVAEVEEFREAAPGIWYPVETRSTLGKNVCSITKVLECRINQPIDEKLLQTIFPEGARVIEHPGERVFRQPKE
jgi:hypothetical protein